MPLVVFVFLPHVQNHKRLSSLDFCLDLLGCYGAGRARAFAEICAAVVLAGETSLACAVVNDDWVTAHERLGRNRP